MNKIPSCGLAVISNHVMFFILSLWCLVKKNYLWTLCDVLIYCLTHLTDLPLLSNCQNLFTSCANVFPFPRTFLEHLKIGEQKSNCGVGGLSAFFAVMQCSLFSFCGLVVLTIPQCPPPAQKSFQLAPSPLPPKQKWVSRINKLQFFCNLSSPKDFTCPSGKLRTEFSSLIVKCTSPGLSDTTFFAPCVVSTLTECTRTVIINF